MTMTLGEIIKDHIGYFESNYTFTLQEVTDAWLKFKLHLADAFIGILY